LRVVETYALDGGKLNSTSKKELGYLGPDGETPGQPLAVTGEVLYRERIAMPEGAVVTVRVSDVSRADAPADVIGEQVIETPGNVPVKFSVGYDPAKIQPGHTYAVSARIEVNGQLMWINTTHIPVITNGNPTSDVAVLVQRVGGN
jgi:putative lipoprotein